MLYFTKTDYSNQFMGCHFFQNLSEMNALLSSHSRDSESGSWCFTNNDN